MQYDLVLLRIFTTTADNRHPCDNCGAHMTSNGGTCGRCLDLPYCKVCKRHLTNYCFDQPNICQVTNKPICLYYYINSFTLTTFARLTSVVVFFQACTRKRNRRPRINHAVEHIVTEVSIPTDPTDTSFALFMERNREGVRRTVDALFLDEVITRLEEVVYLTTMIVNILQQKQ